MASACALLCSKCGDPNENGTQEPALCDRCISLHQTLEMHAGHVDSDRAANTPSLGEALLARLSLTHATSEVTGGHVYTGHICTEYAAVLREMLNDAANSRMDGCFAAAAIIVSGEQGPPSLVSCARHKALAIQVELDGIEAQVQATLQQLEMNRDVVIADVQAIYDTRVAAVARTADAKREALESELVAADATLEMVITTTADLAEAAAFLDEADVTAHFDTLMGLGKVAYDAVEATPVLPVARVHIAVAIPEHSERRDAVASAMGVLTLEALPATPLSHIHNPHCEHAADDAALASAYRSLPSVYAPPQVWTAAVAGAFALNPNRTIAKKLMCTGWDLKSLLLSGELRTGDDALAATCTILGDPDALIGLVPANVDYSDYTGPMLGHHGLGHWLDLGTGAIYSGRNKGGPDCDWGIGEPYARKVPHGTGVAVRLLTNGDVHFIVGGVDMGCAGKVPLTRRQRFYRLAALVYNPDATASLS